MIVLCPSCDAPFQVEDGQIAPLVQVACPTCRFRMILDFEAANDPRLAGGARTTSGYRTPDDYWAAREGVSVGAEEAESAAAESAAAAEAAATARQRAVTADAPAEAVPTPPATAPATVAHAPVEDAPRLGKQTLIATKAIVPGQQPAPAVPSRPPAVPPESAAARRASEQATMSVPSVAPPTGAPPPSTQDAPPLRKQTIVGRAVPTPGGPAPHAALTPEPELPRSRAPEPVDEAEIEANVDIDEEFGDAEQSQPEIIPGATGAATPQAGRSTTAPQSEIPAVTPAAPEGRVPPHTPRAAAPAPVAPPTEGAMVPASAPSGPHPAELSHAGDSQPLVRRRSRALPILIVGFVLLAAAVAAAFFLDLLPL